MSKHVLHRQWLPFHLRHPSNITIRKSYDSWCIKAFATESTSNVASTFASAMPPWIVALSLILRRRERERLGARDYQLMQQTKHMRKMGNCRLLDELYLPPKRIQNFCTQWHANDNGLYQYLQPFFCPEPGAWPAQFYVRQVQKNLPLDIPPCLM